MTWPSAPITADHLLNTTVTVMRRRMTPDGMGGQISEWFEVGEFPARIAQGARSGRDDQTIAKQLTMAPNHRAYFRFGTDVARGDRILTTDGRELSVRAMLYPSQAAYVRADCVHRQEEEEEAEAVYG
jgi:head-tail adaptor